jgi:sulfur relay (sulfurtransferase) complex TusBCD TusD component (DsrE family)
VVVVTKWRGGQVELLRCEPRSHRYLLHITYTYGTVVTSCARAAGERGIRTRRSFVIGTEKRSRWKKAEKSRGPVTLAAAVAVLGT